MNGAGFRIRGLGRYASTKAEPESVIQVPEGLYERWLVHVFGRMGEPPRTMEFDFDDFSASKDEIVGLFSLTMRHAAADFRWASDDQVNAGLYGLFNPGWSNICFTLLDDDIRVDRYAAIRSIKHLYTGVFSQRCRPSLSSLSEPGTALNSICYMLWDVSPLGYGKSESRLPMSLPCVVDVMRFALSIDHDACRESALHGLGHLALHHADLVEPVVVEFLQNAASLRPELVSYAQHAVAGRVQ